jgi:DNA replication and repair protein RecF
LFNVRNHVQTEVPVAPRLTVLVGGNGTGKTSVLEAIHLLLTGASPRTASPREIIRSGESFLRVEADFSEEEGRPPVTAALSYDLGGERRVWRNGSPLEDFSRWERELPVRAFLPDHLQLVKGSPRRRRAYVDLLGVRREPAYRRIQQDYEEALRQRNSLLRQGHLGQEHAPWEAILSRQGLALTHRRAALLAEFTPYFQQAHAALSERTGVSLVYRTNLAELDSPAYREALQSERGGDRQRNYTRLGPHRDDVRFLLEGRDLRDLGSQGEQRTILLALLLAEREWLKERGGRISLLLLDDVMGELDFFRRRQLLTQLGSEGQALITTTTLDYFTSEELDKIALVALGEQPPGAAGGSLMSDE